MKKWTYLVAAGMLLGATPVFTGCIDNDEPEGITILRGAKAELLKAKAAVEAAKVAQVQADAALTQAQAKVQEAEATKIQAEAKKIEAEAKIAEANAALVNAQTETEKARLQAIIEENQRLQKEWEENAAVRAAEAEAAIQEAEYRALQAKAKYQQALVSLQSAQQRVLSPYIATLNTVTSGYFDALDALRIAQRNYNNQEIVVEENEASKEIHTRSLQKSVNIAEASLAGANEALKLANEELAEAQELKPSPLCEKLKDVEDKYTSIQKDIADLSVEAAETVAGFYANGRFEEVNDLLDKTVKAIDATQTIAAVDFDFGDGSGYPAYVQRGVESLPELEYASNDPWNYYGRLADLQKKLDEFKSWTRDANDNAWTQELISEMESNLSDLETNVIAYHQKAWKEAVDAYKTGDYNKTDMTKISGYKEVVDEIAKFNKAAEELNKALAEQVRLERKLAADKKVKEDAIEKSKTDQTAAKKDALDVHTTAMKNVNTVYDTKVKNLKAAYDNAVKLTAEKKKALDEALKGTDSDKITAARNALTNAEKAEKEANDKWIDYVANGLQQEKDAINLAKKTADDKADAKQLTDETNAKKAFDALWGVTGTETASKKTADAKVSEERKDMNKATDALKNVSTTYNDNISEHAVAVGATPISLSMIDAIAGGAWDKEAGYDVRATDLTASKLIVLDKDALKYAVLVRSSFLYGGSIWDTNEYGDFEARLEVLTDADILKLIDANIQKLAETQTISLTDYINECYSYGSVGERLALKEEIRIAKSWLTNKDAINAKIAQTQTAIDELTKAYEANEDAIEAIWEEYNLASEKLEADLEATIEPITKKRAELAPLNALYNAIYHAIVDYSNAGEEMWSENTIQNYINLCKASVENYENEVYEAETTLMNAKDLLEKWNSSAISWLKVLQEKVEDAQALVDRKKKELDNAQAALDAMLANLSVE